MKGIFALLAVTIAVTVSACSKGPEPIRWGADTCDQCRMILSDKRFGAELVADRVYKFDGVDELAKFQAAHPEKKGAPYVTDGDSGNIVPAAGAVFVGSPDLAAPMGGNVMSFATRGDAEQFVTRRGVHGARYLGFAEALALGKGGSDAGH